jgi:hypothetical protein
MSPFSHLISVTKTENNTLLPNGNVLADTGSYTKTDGTVGSLGEIGHLGDVDLTENTFFSSYTDTVPLTPEAQQLPDIHGSGRVRNLREAASLSGDLTNALTTYANATSATAPGVALPPPSLESTRAGQLGQLDALLKVWSDTSDMPDVVTPKVNPMFCTMQHMRRNEISLSRAA